MLHGEHDTGPDDSLGTQRVPGVLSLKIPENIPVPVLIAAPHGGRAYPADVLKAFRRPDVSLRLEDRHVDDLAALVAEQTGACLLLAEAPRAMIDLNRSPEDIDWSMIAGAGRKRVPHSIANRRARNGLGLVPRRLPNSGEIWKANLARTELDRRIETIHRPYHKALATTLDLIRDRWGGALLLDLHSMPPLPVRHGEAKAAEFVVGDRFGLSCDARISATAINYLGSQDRPVAHNRPYSGGYVLDRHGMPRRGIHAVQLEVCRSAYLDRDLVNPSARMPGLARLLAGLVRALAAEIDVADHRQAAE